MEIKTSIPMEYWPDNVDGSTYLPENHRKIIETDTITIVNVFIGAHKKEKPHTHNSPSFMFVDHPSQIEVYQVNEKGEETMLFREKEKPLIPEHPQAFQMSKESFHYVSNTDERDYKAIRVEFKLKTPKDEWLKDLTISEKKSLEIESCDSERLLLSNINTSLSVKVWAENFWENYDPCFEVLDRPKIWYLSSSQVYRIENKGSQEQIYLLKI